MNYIEKKVIFSNLVILGEFKNVLNEKNKFIEKEEDEDDKYDNKNIVGNDGSLIKILLNRYSLDKKAINYNSIQLILLHIFFHLNEISEIKNLIKI